MLAGTDGGPSAVVRLPHCAKAPPRGREWRWSCAQRLRAGPPPCPGLCSAGGYRRSRNHAKTQQRQVDSPGLLTKGTLSTCRRKDCESVDENACTPLPLGNTWVTHNKRHLCLGFARLTLAQQSHILGWQSGRVFYVCWAHYPQGRYPPVGLGIRPLPSSQV